jgi:hypothetical protein
MSNKGGLTITSLATKIFGALVLIMGLLLVTFSQNTEIDIINSHIFSPLGLVIAIFGSLMILSKEK